NYLVNYSANAALSADYAAAWGSTTVSWGLVTANVSFEAKVDFSGNASLHYSTPTLSVGATASIPAAPGAPDFAQSSLSPAKTYLFLTASWTTAATQPVTVTVTDPHG